MADSPQPEKLEKLNRFDNISQGDLKKIVKAGRQVHLPKDWTLFAESTPADKAYLIVEGTVSVRHHGEEVATLGAGDIIGEMAIVNHKLRNASVVSVTELELVHFTKEAVTALAQSVPSFGQALRETSEDRAEK